MALYSFEGNAPQIAETAYVHESAHIVGNVVIGEECFIGAGAIIRGDKSNW
jgi:carbonic anhydrase/acetyltransferase-like protein (isoleucine patch superfamily)